MQLKRTTIAAGSLLLAGALAACGGGSSSSSTATGAAGSPTNASKGDFCGSFQTLSAKATPAEVATQLEKVGTPQDIDSSARHGFEVFLDKIKALPANAGSSALDNLQNSLSSADQKDVLAFVTYTQKECAGSLPSAPAS